MDFDKKDGSSYLDGLPLKIASSFLPPAPVVLPAFVNTEVLSLEKFQYDFSLEKKALECVCKMKEKKKEECKISQPENMCNKLQNPTSKSSIPTSMQTIFSLQSDILLPKTKKNLDKVSNSEENSSKINLSDFENDMSSPFDYMELQTINDLEELSNVFQGLNNKYYSDDAVCKEKNSDSSGLNENNVSSRFSKSMSFPLENNDSFENSETEKVTQKKTPKENSFLNLDDSRMQEAFSTVLPKVPFFACPSIKNNNVLDKSSLRVCKSYSDIHNLSSNYSSESITMPGRSSTPPVMDTTSKTFSVQEETYKIVDCDNLSGLPDPYNELPEDDRRFVDAISDMGFPRAQVSRTVRHLGRDEKMVVEHLCQIQNLEESGYDCLEAEAALHLHDYKQDQAKKFLDLINKFQDLGFEKDAVKKALIQNKNDWSKTIDALLS